MSDPTIGLKPLVSEMIGKDCLNGWDMLVSYSEEDLNKLLQRRHEKVTGISDMAPFDVPIKTNIFDPGPGTPYTMALKLAKPLMHFTRGTTAGINLTFELSGTGTNKEANQSVPLLPGLLLNVSSSLVDVPGTTSGGLEDMTPSPDKPPLPAKSVVLLEPGTVHGVCIDLRDASISITQDEKAAGDKIDQATLDSYSINLGPYIAMELRRAGALKYYITGVNPAPSSSSTSLKPTSFCFSSTDGKSPALLMWIGVEGGTGKGSQSVSFHPDSLDRSPIPEGSTASLLISHDIMAKMFVKASLENAGFSSIESLSGKTDEGMKLKVKCPPMREVKDGNTRNILKVDTIDTREPRRTIHVDGIDIDVSANYAQLVLRSPQPLRGVSPPLPTYSATYEQTALNDLFNEGRHKNKDAILTWISPQQTVEWDLLVRQGAEIVPNHDSGTDKLDYSFAASADWTGDSYQLSMSWTIDSDFKNHMESLDKTTFWNKMFGQDPGKIPENYTEFKPRFPTSFKIDMTPVNYFLATNLLFPGEDIFIPDDPSRTNEAKGLAFPRDTILTGSIISPPPETTTLSVCGPDMPALAFKSVATKSLIAQRQGSHPSEAALRFINTFGDVSRDDALYKHLFVAAGLGSFEERDAAFDKAFQRFGLAADPDELMALIGWDREAFLKVAGEALSGNGGELSATKRHPVSDSSPTRSLQSNNDAELSLDLMKSWAAVYDTSNGSMFVVFPDTGYFSYPYMKNSTTRITPKVLSTNQAQWDDGDSTYVITFTAEPDLTAMVFKYSFVCKVTSPNKFTIFTGTRKDADMTITNLNTSVTVLGLGFGLFGIIMAIVSCKWRSNDQKAKVADNEALLKALDERNEAARKRESQEKSDAAEARCRRQMRIDVAWPSGDYQGTIEKTIRAHIDTSPYQWKNSIGEIGNAIIDGHQNSMVNDIRKDMVDALKKEIIKKVSVQHLIEWETRFVVYEEMGILKDGRIGELAQDSIERELVSKIEAQHDGTSWIEDRFRENFAQLLEEQARAHEEKLGSQLFGIDLDMETTAGYKEWRKAIELQKGLEELAKERDLEETERRLLEDAKKEIEKNVELNQKETEREKIRRDIEKRRELAEKLEKESLEARKRAERKQEAERIFDKHK